MELSDCKPEEMLMVWKMGVGVNVYFLGMELQPLTMIQSEMCVPSQKHARPSDPGWDELLFNFF